MEGRDLSPLVAVCRSCHDRIDKDENGRARNVWNEKEAILARLVAEKERQPVRGVEAPDFRRRRRPKSSTPALPLPPYEKGRDDRVTLISALRTYNARPPIVCPYAEGTPERAEYDRGWGDTGKIG